jgi:hypothetical protein
MTGFALLGALVIVILTASGVYWLMTNITLKSQQPKYTYYKDENGDECVKENTDAGARTSWLRHT